MKLTYCGHSTFLVETRGKKMLIDPFLTPNELTTQARERISDPALKANLDPERVAVDVMLLSHGHGDHVADAPAIALRTGAKVVSNYEIVTWMQEKGVQNFHPLNHGGKVQLDVGTVKYVNAVHSSVLPDGTYGGNPGGFVIWNDETCFYFAGDTALSLDMKLIPMTCPRLDFAILPIGDNFTMGYADAIIASDFIECDRIIGCHFDTFPYIKIDHAAAKKAFADKGKELILLPIGEPMSL